MRSWLIVTVAVASAACGESPPAGAPLAPATDLAIVAHAGDDLVFMQPELHDAVLRGTGVTVVYVTAGEPHGADDLDRRSDGLQAAYSAIAGNDDWSCGWILSGATNLEHCRLASGKVSLVFLGYPDGGADGAAPTSLLNLWEANTTSVQTVSRRPSMLDQAELIRVVADLIDVTAPTTLRTLEIASTHGRDHSDHMLVGALAVLATAQSTRDPAVTSYRGENIADLPANVDPALADRAAGVVARYEACASGCAACGAACALDALPPDDASWLSRRYPVATRAAATGQLRQGTSCVTVTTAGANAALVDCTTAPSWQLDGHGRLRADTGLCLRALFTGEIVATACGDDGAGGRFWFDDEGHLWSGLVPIPQANMALAHLDCLIEAGGRPRAALCGATRAPVWQIAPSIRAE